MNELTKSSSSEEIKKYFNAILKLAKSNEKYPVNLDEVWMLMYKNRDDAVKSLKRDFIEKEDFISIRQESVPDNQIFNPNPRIDYKLTVSCLEYFVVKKIRPVFEVYSKVFHKAPEMIKQIKQATLKEKIVVADWMSSFLNLNDVSKLRLAQAIAEPLGLPIPDYVPSKGLLKSASTLLSENGLSISSQVFNQKMIEKGYLVELTRPSSNGSVKKFKSIVGEGLKFGENDVHPSNSKGTQPQYYEDKFAELLLLLQLKQIA